MSFKFDKGLFDPEFMDYHAILGVPVDADLKDIRKRYLSLARRLHPDSCIQAEVGDRQQASTYLSKLVNPAYEKLSQEKAYSEHCVCLRLKGQLAVKQPETVTLTSEPAQKLTAASEIEASYHAAVRQMAEQQYQQLDQTLNWIGQLSELNLVYLMRKNGRFDAASLSSSRPLNPVAATGAASPAPSEKPAARPEKAPATMTQLVEACLRRAHEFEVKQDFGRAMLELREAIKINPNSSDVHSRLGAIYLRSNQPTMAKIHFNKALELNPQDQLASEGKRKLDPSSAKLGGVVGNAKVAVGKPTAGAKPAAKGSKPDSGGLFGLFGNKKK
jgi:tetratricopeptide (TPR) repeat protein